MSTELPETPAPTVGILAALAVLAAVAAPYFLVPTSAATVYYDSPIFVPIHLVVVLFASVVVIVFAAGRNGRTDPETAAGAALVLAGVTAGLTLWWAVAVGGTVGGLTDDATFDYHRWVLAAATLSLAAVAGWYARDAL
ncbi:hypothetical protein NGM10_02905 [Halorussus salilacus]|uniref:DUF7548 family protein n=1 Tax=Halorussus salilacus TaxID=2953750 RepID=UPI0020A0129A|nr:hypothetical protein [Halorussus salilacus]USZ68696.1 hypothetical protein NGM10_02905 [Halorussus salilacus]